MSQQHEQYKSEEEQLWRANIYGLLSSLLAVPPDEGTLNMLSQLKGHIQSEPGTSMEIALHRVTTLAQNLDQKSIWDEFQVLFIGVTRGEVVPYGSFYQSGFMMDKPLAELRTCLSTLGYERREEVYESEDHVAALCDVMRGLITDPEDDFHTSLLKQQVIYHEHISPWIMKFFQDLQDAKHSDFYSSLAILGKTFMLLEGQYLKMDG